MSIRNILIILLVILLLVLFFRNRGSYWHYELKGKVTMINNCTNNTADLDDKIRIKAKLHFHGTNPRPESFFKTFDAPVSNATTRVATYSLKVGNNVRAKEWKVESITRRAGTDICTPIPCTAPQICTDTATVAGDPYTVPVPSGQQVVTQDYRFSCTCLTPPQPPPPTEPPQ